MEPTNEDFRTVLGVMIAYEEGDAAAADALWEPFEDASRPAAERIADVMRVAAAGVVIGHFLAADVANAKGISSADALRDLALRLAVDE